MDAFCPVAAIYASTSGYEESFTEFRKDLLGAMLLAECVQSSFGFFSVNPL